MDSKSLPEDVLIRRALDALFAELGTVEAVRFLSLAQRQSIRLIPPADEQALEQLLAGVTDENLHGEISAGPAAGVETW